MRCGVEQQTAMNRRIDIKQQISSNKQIENDEQNAIA